MEVNSTEISEYVKSMLNGITDGVGEDFVVMEPIRFEIAVVNEITEESEGKAGIEVHVLGVGGKLGNSASTEHTSKVTIAVAPRITEEKLKDKTFLYTQWGFKEGEKYARSQKP